MANSTAHRVGVADSDKDELRKRLQNFRDRDKEEARRMRFVPDDEVELIREAPVKGKETKRDKGREGEVHDEAPLIALVASPASEDADGSEEGLRNPAIGGGGASPPSRALEGSGGCQWPCLKRSVFRSRRRASQGMALGRYVGIVTVD